MILFTSTTLPSTDPLKLSQKEHENKVYWNLYGGIHPMQQGRFKVGDKGRIKKKGAFEKWYTPRWTKKVFTVSKEWNTQPKTYRLKDLNDKKKQGSSEL